MAGVYTDNQPDFSWLLPGETKTFTQYWYPIPAIGPAHQATTDAAVHVDRGTAEVTARFAVTSPQRDARMRILVGGDVVAERTADLTPGEPAQLAAAVIADDPLTVELRDRDGLVLVAWSPAQAAEGEPWVATEPPLPAEIDSVEELYLTGLHLSQYRHPTRSALDYWQAALALDAGDVRTNLALADREYRDGRYEVALTHIETALSRLTRRNANPADAEAFYLYGLVLRRLGRTVEAERAFGKAGWDGTWAAAAGLALARSLARRGCDRDALRVLDTLDGVVGYDARRPALRAILLRRLGRNRDADSILANAMRIDPLDATLRVLAGIDIEEDGGVLTDVAIDLRDAGESRAAVQQLWRAAGALPGSGGNWRPLAHYLAAAIFDEQGAAEQAASHRAQARRADLPWAFPAGLDALDALQSAVAADPSDSVAQYLLGTLLYAQGRREEAVDAWKTAIELGMQHPVLLRDAAVAAYNVTHDDDLAWQRYEQAIALAPDDARLRYEQDQLAARLGHSTEERLERLRPVRELVLTRDDLTISYVNLLIAEGDAGVALVILSTRPFHPWEGGEGQALAAWDAAREALGMPIADPPATLGEARPAYVPPVAVRDDGVTDYFATSLPELLLFTRS